MDYPNMKFAFIYEPENIDDLKLTKYELHGRMPYLKSKIGDKEIFMYFDTGAVGWLYFPLSLKDSVSFKVPLKKWKKLWNNQTGTTESFIGQVNENINFGDFNIELPWIFFEPGLDEVLVSSSLLKEFKLTFYVDKKLVGMERTSSSNKIVIPIQD